MNTLKSFLFVLFISFTFYLHANNHQTTTANTMMHISEYMSEYDPCRKNELKYAVEYVAARRVDAQAIRASLDYIVGRRYEGIYTHVVKVEGMGDGGTQVSFVQKEVGCHPRLDMFICMSLVLNILPRGFTVLWGEVWVGLRDWWTCQRFDCRVPMWHSCGEYTSHHAEGTMTSAVADWGTWGASGWIADGGAFVPCDDEREEELRAVWRKFRDDGARETLGDVLVFEMNDDGTEGVGHWEAPPRRHNFRRDIKSRRKGFNYADLTRDD